MAEKFHQSEGEPEVLPNNPEALPTSEAEKYNCERCEDSGLDGSSQVFCTCKKGQALLKQEKDQASRIFKGIKNKHKPKRAA